MQDSDEQRRRARIDIGDPRMEFQTVGRNNEMENTRCRRMAMDSTLTGVVIHQGNNADEMASAESIGDEQAVSPRPGSLEGNKPADQQQEKGRHGGHPYLKAPRQAGRQNETCGHRRFGAASRLMS